ncbi:MAG: CotH kinase family protein [Verrucomicrobia bacterium]|nr:CotH kinase family protein [Verrucomicrobiota bacterium]
MSRIEPNRKAGGFFSRALPSRWDFHPFRGRPSRFIPTLLGRSPSFSLFAAVLAGLFLNSGLSATAASPRVLITEVMAANHRTVMDEDRQPSDWIELFNAGAESVSLLGWHLTDDSKDLRKWTFPETKLLPGEYLLVFASGKNRRQSGKELHTNFKLDTAGEYLGLIEADGRTIAFQFKPKLPPLRPDVSYGIPLVEQTITLLAADAVKSARVPTSDPGEAWKSAGYSAADWSTGRGGIGYDSGTNLLPWIRADVGALMRSKSASLMLRAPFLATNADVSRLSLRMYYNDGFVAWLNGQEVARRNVATNVAWNGSALRSREKLEPVAWRENFDDEDPNVALMNADANGRARIVSTPPNTNHYLRLVNGRLADQMNGAAFPQRVASPAQRFQCDFEFRSKSPQPSASDLYLALIPTGRHGERGIGEPLEMFQHGRDIKLANALVIQLELAAGGRESQAIVHWNGDPHVQAPVSEPSLGWRFYHKGVVDVQFTDRGAVVSLSVTTDVRGGTGKDVSLLKSLLIPGVKPYASRLQMVAHTRSQLSTFDLDNLQGQWVGGGDSVYEDIDLTFARQLLKPGQNILAVMAYNAKADDTGFLILPELYAHTARFQLDSPRYFSPATPLAANLDPGLGAEAGKPSISPRGGMLHGPQRVEMSTSTAGGVVRYTLDGREPTEGSPAYVKPFTIDSPAVIKARVYAPGYLPSLAAMETFNQPSSDVADFDSNLPILILTSQGRVRYDSRKTPLVVRLIEPGSGRASLNGEAQVETRGDYNIRGFSSTRYPKKSYTVRLRDEFGEKTKTSLLGLPKESDWVLYAPFPDKTLMRDALAYDLSRRMGHYAARTRFVEVFVNQVGDSLSWRDYQGVYVLVEKIKRGKNRVDIHELGPGDSAEPEISGGYIFKRDHSNKEGAAFYSRGGEYFFVEPSADEVTPTQKDWLQRHFQQAEHSIYGKNFMDPSKGYRRYIDVPSLIDQHWLVELSKNIDGFRYSVYFSKDRGGKIKLEPVWDWNLSFGNANYLDGESPSGWYSDQLRDSEITWVRRLVEDPEFNQEYIDRWWELRRGPFQLEAIIKRVDQMAAELGEAQSRNFRRWPILGRFVHPNSFVGSSYEEEVNWMKAWIRRRIAWIDGQMGHQPPSIAAKLDGAASRLTVKGRGQVYYTLDGTDPRKPGGEPSPAAKVYENPISLKGVSKIIVRSRSGDTWSAPNVWQDGG